jgi:hypothetical protein
MAQSAGARELAAEREAWERDHPGQQFPDHECELSDCEYTDLARWQCNYARKRAPGRQA